jgi:hypothetical protein
VEEFIAAWPAILDQTAEAASVEHAGRSA